MLHGNNYIGFPGMQGREAHLAKGRSRDACEIAQPNRFVPNPEYNNAMDDPRRVELLRLLVNRMERLSADSHWARRAGGVRGNLLKVLDEIDGGQGVEAERMDLLIDHAFELLRRAAMEIPDLEEWRRKDLKG